MRRRAFIHGAGAGTLVLAAAGPGRAAPPPPAYRWRMVTTWPRNLPGLGTAASQLAELIGEMSGGRLTVKVFGAGELVAPMAVFDAVARGTAEMGHGCAYFWRDKSEALQFFSAVPFGMTAQEMNAWVYHGGGLELWTELYARFGLIPAPAGNTGVQMGGWFNREIRTVADLQGLRMRIPGLGGQVLARAGGTPVDLPAGAELFTALKSGTIDAAEWVGPYGDLAFDLYKVSKYYYYPGWHEPGTLLEAMINKQAFESLPPDLRAIVRNACKVVNQDLLVEFTAHNPATLKTLVTKHHVELRRFPPEVVARLRVLADEVVAEFARKDEFSARVYASYKKFLTQAREWSDLSEWAYLQARDQPT